MFEIRQITGSQHRFGLSSDHQTQTTEFDTSEANEKEESKLVINKLKTRLESIFMKHRQQTLQRELMAVEEDN